MRIVGIDISLTSTGLAEWYDGDRRTAHHGQKGKLTDTLQQRGARLQRSRDETIKWCLQDEQADVALIESHTFAAKGGSQHDRSGLWWLVVRDLFDLGIKVVEISPSQIKQFATGKGNAPKEAVMLATARRHPDIEFTTDDEADALNLVDMALVHRGMLSATAIQHKSLLKVVW